MKKVFAVILLAACCVLLLAGCGASASANSEAAASQKFVKVYDYGDSAGSDTCSPAYIDIYSIESVRAWDSEGFYKVCLHGSEYVVNQLDLDTIAKELGTTFKFD